MRAWGTQTDVTERRRARKAQRFLAEASDMLASSLDYRETLSSVARLAVPTLADWCVVDVLDENGSLERLAVEHPDPGRWPWYTSCRSAIPLIRTSQAACTRCFAAASRR